jgi:hypothetical protein
MANGDDDSKPKQEQSLGFLTGLQKGMGGPSGMKELRSKIKGGISKVKSHHTSPSGSPSGSGGTSGSSGSAGGEATSETEAVSMKKGGPVRKTGLAKVHKGEYVLTKRQTQKAMGAEKVASSAKRMTRSLVGRKRTVGKRMDR